MASWHDLRLTSLRLVGLAVSPSDGMALANMLAHGCGATLQALVLVRGLQRTGRGGQVGVWGARFWGQGVGCRVCRFQQPGFVVWVLQEHLGICWLRFVWR